LRFSASLRLPILIALAAIVPAAAAHAHAELMSTSPAAGHTVVATRTVTLHYDDVVQLPPRALRITGPDGNPVPVQASLPDSKTLAGRLGSDPGAGPYAVRWRIVADDGHIESGKFSFVMRKSSKRAGVSAVPARGLRAPRNDSGTAAVVLTLTLTLVTIVAIGVGLVRLRRERVYRSGTWGG